MPGFIDYDQGLAMLSLDFERVAVTTNLHREEIRTFYNQGLATDALRVELSGYVLTDRLASEVVDVRVGEYPTTWWQHTKAVHFPTFSRWLNRPPVYEVVTACVETRSKALFPVPKIAYPPDLGPVVIHQQQDVELRMQ